MKNDKDFQGSLEFYWSTKLMKKNLLYLTAYHFFIRWGNNFVKFHLTPTLSGFDISNDSTLTIENWLVLGRFNNIFYDPNFAEKEKWQFL